MAPILGTAILSAKVSRDMGSECTKIAHRRSLAISPQTQVSQGIPQWESNLSQVSQGIPQWESNLSLLIAEKIAVR